MFGGVPGGLQGTGYQFNGMQPQQVPPMKNNLTQEEIQKLIQKENQFSLVVTETEKLRAICNHKWPEMRDGKWDALVETDTGCKCMICGYEFDPIDIGTTNDSLLEAVKNILDILQTIKLLYLDMPTEVAREFYVIIPLIEKIPKLFEIACKSYSKYDNTNGYGFNNKNMNTMQMYNMLVGLLNTPGAPMPGQQWGQPQMNPNPAMGMGYPYGAPMGQPMPWGASNGFVAQPGYTPMTQGFQYDPQAQSQFMNPPAATPAPAAAASTDGKTVTVDTTFKA
jgi:hypothetical protein